MGGVLMASTGRALLGRQARVIRLWFSVRGGRLALIYRVEELGGFGCGEEADRLIRIFPR